ncbi:MAG: sporulation protein YunB [Oscillospiraceae bacterium]|nr:sporulation protein YunB [Oscillospiraceae bacterium]
MRIIRRLFWLLILLSTAAVVCFFLFRSKYQNVITALAQTQVKNATSDLINDAIDAQISSGTIQYDRMVYFEKDLEGKITALKTNMSEVNRLKTDLLNLINDEILAMDSDHLGIPLGSLILPEVFGRKGPVIPVQILTIRNSEADFFSEFSQAGINQTLQKLTMQVSVDVAVLVLGKVDDFTISSQVVIAETVIVGQVPDMFLQTGGIYELQRENG